jgi:Zn-dependent alcohol dehydrogenase
VQTVGALLWEPGTRSGWSVEEIELDPPEANEAFADLRDGKNLRGVIVYGAER